jgi:TolB protein
VEREELEALVEALIEEARQRARRRRRIYWAVATSVALVGTVVFTIFERAAQSQTAAPGLSARSSLPAAAATSKIAFISEPPAGGYCGTVWVMNPDGSGQRRLTNGGVAGCGGEWGHAWSPNGREIAFVGGKNDIYVMNADGSGQRALTPTVWWWPYSPVWSPDGKMIAFVGRGGGSSEGTDWLLSGIYVTNADGSGQRRLLARGYSASLAWSPDGRRIAFESHLQVWVMNADGSGQRRLLARRYPASLAWSPDGRRIAFESNRQVWVMNADGSGQRRLTRNGGFNSAPAWSPDGRRIAFERRLEWCSGSDCGTALHFEVWVMNADGSQARLLAKDAAHRPSWSPDGRKIAFERNLDIYVVNADGSGQRALTRGADRESQPLWSPAQKK